jgi:hypothetical protein
MRSIDAVKQDAIEPLNVPLVRFYSSINPAHKKASAHPPLDLDQSDTQSTFFRLSNQTRRSRSIKDRRFDKE